MRLQLIITGLLGITIHAVCAQPKPSLPPTEIDFLFSYYEQSGDSSAVTGGLGTEELNDIASRIIINIPLDYHKSFELETGISYYTSASSDQIDPNTISSASHKSLVFHVNGDFTVKDTLRNHVRNYNFRFNHQPNFYSAGFGSGYAIASADQNREWQISGQFSYDKWAQYYRLSKLYPREIRRQVEPLHADSRKSFELNTSLKQVINKRMQALAGAGFIYQWGLLSTPFHRVYFTDRESADLERLPATRLRIPLTFRFNYYLNDLVIIRTYYRYYFDDFDIDAHTYYIETPLKITNFFSVYPYYRYYYQNATHYFRPYRQHERSEQFYTSDYDLSRFTSHTIGGGLRISPPLGMGSVNFSEGKSPYVFKSLSLRYASYWRTNGMKAAVISLAVGILH